MTKDVNEQPEESPLERIADALERIAEAQEELAITQARLLDTVEALTFRPSWARNNDELGLRVADINRE